MGRKELERQVLAGLYKYPHLIAEIDSFFKERFFLGDINKTIYKIIRSKFLNGGSVDTPVILKELDNMGYNKKDDVNIDTYIDSFTINDLSEKGALELVVELQKAQARRDVFETGEKLQKFSQGKAGEKSIVEVISEADKIYSDTFTEYFSGADPKNLYSSMVDLINEKAKKPADEDGLITPFKEFNRLYGGFSGGNIYAFVARPKQGKTTLLNHLCDQISRINNVPVMILDTEMLTEEIQFRTAANLSGVPLWYLRTGNWVKNHEMVEKMKRFKETLKDSPKVDHIYVANKDIDQVLSIIRRWYYAVVGKGNKCLIAYDYIKLTGEKLGGNYNETQILGTKISKLKDLANDLNFPIITSMQLNRMAENSHNKNGDEIDSGMISTSDRLSWFASYIGGFVKKNPTSLMRDGKKYGTHKLVTFHSRYQGRDAAGFNDAVLRKDENGNEKYVNNYINFNLENFRVEERGTLEDIVREEEMKLNQNNDGDDDSGNTSF